MWDHVRMGKKPAAVSSWGLSAQLEGRFSRDRVTDRVIPAKLVPMNGFRPAPALWRDTVRKFLCAPERIRTFDLPLRRR